jgi:hypothetical protein
MCRLCVATCHLSQIPQNATYKEAGGFHEPPARVIAFPISYPVSGCVPQSGDWEPPVWVTCVNPVPSALTV